MKLVIDSSVALKWVLPEIDSDKADRLRDDFRNHIHDLIAPDLFPAEIANSLARAERRAVIRMGHASQLFVEVLRTPPQLIPYLPLIDRALTIASTTRASVYDSAFVALAERDGCELVTADDRLIRNLQTHFPFIRALSSFP